MSTAKEVVALIRSDLYRYGGQTGLRSFVRCFLLRPGFNYSVWYRLASLNTLLRFVLLRRSIRFGIQIPHTTRIGPGLYIGHFGNIVVNEEAVIGKNCNLSHGVTIGQLNTGPRRGCPTIGDNVYVAPGAKILGAVQVGNHAAIGANTVVTNDVPERAVVVGVPGRVVSLEGSTGYVNHTVD